MHKVSRREHIMGLTHCGTHGCFYQRQPRVWWGCVLVAFDTRCPFNLGHNAHH